MNDALSEFSLMNLVFLLTLSDSNTDESSRKNSLGSNRNEIKAVHKLIRLIRLIYLILILSKGKNSYWV